MKIGIDIDGTLYPWTSAVNQALRSQYGIADLVEHTHWDYLQEKIGSEAWIWCWAREAIEPVFARQDLIYPFAADIVNDLCKQHEVHFVTHRQPEKYSEVTGRWLSTHFTGYRGVHILGNTVSKASLGNWDVFIDDKVETLEEFGANMPSCLLLAPLRPWNSEFMGTRFSSWLNVPDLLAPRLVAA